MIDRGQIRSERPAPFRGWRLLRAFALVVLAPLWLLLILILPVARVLVQAPLALASLGGFGAGIFFAFRHAWGDALTAGALGLGCAFALVAFTALAERIDPEFSQPDRFPPWWWYF